MNPLPSVPLRHPMPLPRSLRPVAGEWFASYLDRLAHHLDVPLITLLQRVGITSAERMSDVPAGYGAYLVPDALAAFARATHLTTTQARALLLERYHDVCLDFSPLYRGEVKQLGAIGLSEWVYASGSHLCPACIEDDGAWQVAWKLPWSFMCVKHANLLAPECPNCELRFAAWRRDGQLRPLFGSQVPEPGLCTNTGPSSGKRGVRAGQCRHDLRKVDVVAVQPGSQLSRVQARIDETLEAGSATLAGTTVAAPEFFRVLRGTVALLMYAATAKDVVSLIEGTVPRAVQESLERWFDTRDANLARLRRTKEVAARAGEKRRIAPQKLTAFAPTDPALMGGLLSAATAYLDADSVMEAAHRMAPLLEMGSARGGRTSSFITRLGLPPFFTQLYSLQFDSKREYLFDPRRPAQTASKGSYRFEPRHIPQLFWRGEYDSRFRRFFEGLALREETVRLTLSVLLAELVVDGSRAEALKALGVERSAVRGGVDKTIFLLRERGDALEAFAELHAVAEALSTGDQLVDYADRRTRFATFTCVPPVDWAYIAKRANINPGLAGGRDEFVATMAWERLTGSDWRHAPAMRFRAGNERASRETYLRFANSATAEFAAMMALYVQYLAQGGEQDRFVYWARPDILKRSGLDEGYGYGPAHVPQLYWRDEYEDHFERFFQPLGVAAPTGRAAVSVALLELVLSMPRAQSGALIGIDERSIRGGVSAALQRVWAGEHAVAFEERLTASAEELGRNEVRVVYQERRARLAGFTNIPEADWRGICKRAGAHVGRKNVRSVHAAAWLWAELMQQDVRDSPAFKALVRNPHQDYGIHQKFVREQIPRMGIVLLEYGEAHIERSAISGNAESRTKEAPNSWNG